MNLSPNAFESHHEPNAKKQKSKGAVKEFRNSPAQQFRSAVMVPNTPFEYRDSQASLCLKCDRVAVAVIPSTAPRLDASHCS